VKALQSVISYLSGSREHQIQHSATCNYRDTLHQIAQIATVLATCQRFREGQPYVEPRTDLSHGANFLYMLRGAEPDEKGKPLYPNVDFFSGAVYSLLGIPKDLFTPIFAVARTAGWLALVLELRKDKRLYRPRCLYVGGPPAEYVPIDDR
jgi:citrate synthase